MVEARASPSSAYYSRRQVIWPPLLSFLILKTRT